MVACFLDCLLLTRTLGKCKSLMTLFSFCQDMHFLD